MRVTHSMMVNNIAYWASQQAEKLQDAQTVVGSGKIINKPSDDPLVAGKILSDRVSISQYGQYESNIAQAETWIEVSNTTFDTVSSTLQYARDAVDLYLPGGSSTVMSVDVLYDLYNQILALANSPNASGSGYMYSGNISNTMPFTKVSIDAGVPGDINFDLAGAATNVDIQVMNSAGTVVRNITTVGAFAAGSNTVTAATWLGQDDAGDPLPDGQYSIIVTALNGTDAVAAYPSYGGDDGGKEIFTGANESIVLNNDGEAMFSSILSNLSQAITTINTISDISATLPLDSAALAAEQVKLADIADALKNNSADLEAEQVKLYNAGVQLDGASTRLQQLITSTSNSVSDQEMGSPEEAAIKLQVQQTNYEQVISVTANILKMPKLSDYI
jgi:flagellin-like hook-associated protein FlgL